MNFKNATWMSGSLDCEAPILRKEFYVEDDAKSAIITICGLGFFELYINENRVSDDMLVPAWSNYEPRINRRIGYPINDEFTYRTYYLEYNIFNNLNKGVNAIGIRLGNGWYNQHERNAEGDFWYDTVKLCFEIKIVDENENEKIINCSDGLKWQKSEITFNNMYLGERHDLRMKIHNWSRVGFDDSDWKYAQPVNAPDCIFELQTCPTDKIIKKIIPTLIFEDNRRRIFDCGENITGYVVVKTSKEIGKTVEIRHSEEFDSINNKLDFSSAGWECQIQEDIYICADEEYECHPRFCWHGFRYFEVIGNAKILYAALVHADIAVTSEFECSNQTLNWIFEAYKRSQLTNIHCGVPSDCPHRERLGYTGDGQVTADAAMMTLDSRLLYDKWMQDIADSQDIVGGHVQHTAPFYGGGGGPGGWGGAIYLIPLSYYRNYGDKKFLSKYYENIKRWLEYMESRCENGLIVREEEGGWCLGDWNTPNKPEIPEPFVNTYYYIKALNSLLEISDLLNIKVDMRLTEEKIERSKDALKKAYFDKSTHSYCCGANAADAFAIALGIGDEKTLKVLTNKYSLLKTFDTGIFGTDILIDVLFENGFSDLAFELLTNNVKNSSFEEMRRCGATTLWESWDGLTSHNHPMFGGVVRSFFTHILGIKQAFGTSGFSNVYIDPANISGLDWARGSINTPHGKISVSYTKNSDKKTVISTSGVD